MKSKGEVSFELKIANKRPYKRKKKMFSELTLSLPRLRSCKANRHLSE